MNILILHKNTSWGGGVVNFVRMLTMAPNNTYFQSFIIGPRSVTESTPLSRLRPVVDAVNLRQALAQSHIDLVFINPSLDFKSFLRDSLLAFVAKRVSRKPLFVFVHGWEHGFYERIRKSWLLKAIYRAGLLYADHTVVLASSFKDSLIELGADPSRVSTLPTMYLKTEVPELPAKRWHDGGRIEFLFLSRLVREKGIFETIHAFSHLRISEDNIHLHIAGNGPAEIEARKLVEELHLSDAVTFHGYVTSDDKRDLLERASIFVFPTYYGEGCPVSLLEAMAAGLPVITADAGGIKDVFRQECGVLLDNVTDDTVYEAMKKLITSKDSLKDISSYNSAYAGQNFEREKVSASILALCQSTIEARG